MMRLQYINVGNEYISSLQGIQYFTCLEHLLCFDNQLTTLDVSKNTELRQLSCGNNQLTSLDVSANSKLETLWCDNNQLTTLDVSKKPELRQLSCENNQLTSLDVSADSKLETLGCAENQLTALDVSRNTSLNFLRCENNRLTSLDMSKNTKLNILCCNNNQLTRLNLPNNFDMTEFDCSFNKLATLDISKSPTVLNCYNHPFRIEDDNDGTITYVAGKECWMCLDKSVKVIATGDTKIINLSKNLSATINVGDKLRIELGSDKATSFKSSKPSIASVDGNGVVTGVAEGEVVITAAANDESGVSAEVTVTDVNYDASVAMARDDAAKNGWTLVQDTSWPGYEKIPSWIMQGYSTLIYETAEQLDAPPTHVFLQAGVGSMAGAAAACLASS